MSTTVFPALVAGALIIYIIFRQFQERVIQPGSLLLLPALVLYLSYTHLVSEFTHPTMSPVFLVAVMGLGLLIGCFIGFYRASIARMRIDDRTGNVLAKASGMGIFIWMVLLVARLAASVVFYGHLLHPSVLLSLVIALISMLFLGNVLAGNLNLYLRARRMTQQGVLQEQI